MGLDRAQLAAYVGDIAHVGVPDDVHQPERPLGCRHLDERLDVDVAVLNQLPAPVPVGVHLGKRRGRPSDRPDDERRQRQRWVVLGEQSARVGHVDVDEPVHGNDASSRTHGGGD